jgi:hypothetical protein
MPGAERIAGGAGGAEVADVAEVFGRIADAPGTSARDGLVATAGTLP